MNQPTGPNQDCEQACVLLHEYSFELDGYRPEELVAIWQTRLEAEPSWIRAAIVEALYQGRYKALSVEHILQVWKRRGHPLRHFNHDFERVVFGPVDPVASKYASMTTLRPSDLLTPQKSVSDTQGDGFDYKDSETLSAEGSSNTDSDERFSEPNQPDQDTKLEHPHGSASEETTLTTPQVSFSKEPNLTSDLEPAPYAIAAVHSPTLSHPEPIRKFVPQPMSSEFYFRLQSVARHHF